MRLTSSSASQHHASQQFMVDFLAKAKSKKDDMSSTTRCRHHEASTSTTAHVNNENISSSSKLIVDFPTQPRHHQTPISKKQKEKKTVRFVEYSELALFEPYHTTMNCNKLWYNEDDKIEFKRQRLEDIIFTHKMVAANKKLHGISITREQLYRSIGVEKMVNREKALGIAHHQRRHSKTIVLKQDTCTPNELCKMARQSSKQSRLRACLVASTWAKYSIE